MRLEDDNRPDIVKQKAILLERENIRLRRDFTAALRRIQELEGMSAEAIELNIDGLVEQAIGGEPAKRASERRRRPSDKPLEDKPKQTGHGPTEQPELELSERTFDVDEPDRFCDSCGGDLQEWSGAEDVVQTVEFIPPKWIVHNNTLKKYRCQCVLTAEPPKKLVAGGRYELSVAVNTAVAKFVDHLPLERQAKRAQRVGMKITSQTLWDQQLALANHLDPLALRIKDFALSDGVIGVDLSPYKLISKGGSIKRQIWQVSSARARYFEILESKHAHIGRSMFETRDDDGRVISSFKGTAVVDGANELARVAADVGFTIANCWGHARRNVLKAESEAPGQVDQFLDIVGELYAIEREAARAPPVTQGGYRQYIDLDELRILRDTKSRAVLDRLKKWMLEQSCIPGGNLKKGLNYVAERWSGLTRFLDDPAIPLDNNRTEGGFIHIAIGRRNYVGSRSERGCRVAAILYTVIETAILSGADPAKYLAYAAELALDGGPPLLPHEWVAKAR